jgi:hypothetical protein
MTTETQSKTGEKIELDQDDLKTLETIKSAGSGEAVDNAIPDDMTFEKLVSIFHDIF